MSENLRRSKIEEELKSILTLEGLSKSVDDESGVGEDFCRSYDFIFKGRRVLAREEKCTNPWSADNVQYVSIDLEDVQTGQQVTSETTTYTDYTFDRRHDFNAKLLKAVQDFVSLGINNNWW